MAVLLAGLSLFIYSRFQAGVDSSLDQGLRARTTDVRALVLQADSGLSSASSGALASAARGFAQILRRDGSVLDTTSGIPHRSLLTPVELRRAARSQLLIENRDVGAATDDARLLATPVTAQGQHLVIVVGADLGGRAAALADLRTLLLLGGPAALLLASLLGYAVSALSLRSVERMRRRARELSVTALGNRLPVPRTGDELARLAETLNEMHARNEAAYARQQRFVADASHELRAPLAILRAELELALTGPPDVDALQQANVSALEEADRLAQLTEDLLTLAQADAERLSLNLSEFPASAVFERVSRRFESPVHNARRALSIDASDDPVVHGDAARVERALTNLLDNALRHGAGAIVLSAHRSDNDRVALHVCDNGPGFDEGYLTSAFERFTRPDPGRNPEGFGLGMSIVASIAAAHGGEAHAANRREGGADVWIVLPAAATVPSHAAPESGADVTRTAEPVN
jgi:signal transduction histidine kinase